MLTAQAGFLAISLGLALVLAGCAQVTSAGTASQSATTTLAATRSPAVGNGSTVNGCPSKQASVDSGAFHADVAASYTGDQGAAQPVALAQGQGLEIHLAPNVHWSLNLTDTNRALNGLQPAGWFDPAEGACVWRFVGVRAGDARLTFRGPVLCPPNIHCTAVFEQAAFDVTVR